MQDKLRDYFDQQLEIVLQRVPQQVRDLLEVVPLFVEDFPSQNVLQRLGIRDRSRLCGLYTGVPLTQRHVEQSGVLSDVIHLYREGILFISQNPSGEVDEGLLQEEIRKTLLHELGHHHGMTESDLENLGY